MMTAADRLFSYFPLMMTAASLTALGIFARFPSIWTAILLLFILYVLPLTVQRVMFRWAPLKQGISAIDGATFSPWLASHHIQAFYDALPYLESLLRVIPGFYSMWLRMWGSRIGYGVVWPVRMDVLDRGLVDVGNRVTFDREVELAAHVRDAREPGAHRRGAAAIGARVLRLEWADLLPHDNLRGLGSERIIRAGVDHEDRELLYALVREHRDRTMSLRARTIIAKWEWYFPLVRKVEPRGASAHVAAIRARYLERYLRTPTPVDVPVVRLTA